MSFFTRDVDVDFLFSIADYDRDGVININDATRFFTGAYLSVQEMGTIWMMTVTNLGLGILTRDNFGKALMLISLTQKRLPLTAASLSPGALDPPMFMDLDPTERTKYEAIFTQNMDKATQKVSGQTALGLFTAYGVDRQVLFQIWQLSDMDLDGSLSGAEFLVAMALIKSVLSGRVVPSVVPSTLLYSVANKKSVNAEEIKVVEKPVPKMPIMGSQSAFVGNVSSVSPSVSPSSVSSSSSPAIQQNQDVNLFDDKDSFFSSSTSSTLNTNNNNNKTEFSTNLFNDNDDLFSKSTSTTTEQQKSSNLFDDKDSFFSSSSMSSTTTTTTNNNKTEFSTNAANLFDNNDALSPSTTTTVATTTDIQIVTEELKQIDEKIAAIQKEFKDVHEAVEIKKVQAQAIKDRNASLVTQQDTLQRKCKSIQDEATLREMDLEQVQSEIEKNKGGIKTAESEIEESKRSIEEAKAQNEKLGAALGAALTKYSNAFTANATQREMLTKEREKLRAAETAKLPDNPLDALPKSRIFGPEFAAAGNHKKDPFDTSDMVMQAPNLWCYEPFKL